MEPPIDIVEVQYNPETENSQIWWLLKPEYIEQVEAELLLLGCTFGGSDEYPAYYIPGPIRSLQSTQEVMVLHPPGTDSPWPVSDTETRYWLNVPQYLKLRGGNDEIQR